MKDARVRSNDWDEYTSGLKARTITCHANTSDTQSNDTRQTRTNIYPHGTPHLKRVHIHNFAVRLRAR